MKTINAISIVYPDGTTTFFKAENTSENVRDKVTAWRLRNPAYDKCTCAVGTLKVKDDFFND